MILTFPLECIIIIIELYYMKCEIMPRRIVIEKRGKCLLVVTGETHEVVAYHALKHNISLQEATQDLLDVAITKLYGVNSAQFLERKRT